MRHTNISKSSDHNDIGRDIAARRRVLGLTQEQLAFMVHLSRQSISNIEQGKQIPSGKALIRIMASLDMQTDSNHNSGYDPRLVSLALQLKEMPEQAQDRFFDIADVILAGLIHKTDQ